MTILIIVIAVVSIALGAAGTVWAQDYWRQRKAPRELKPILDWRPTLRMDARATAEAELSEDDNVPAQWTLQTEEIRLVLRASAVTRMSRSAGVRLLAVRCVTMSPRTSGPGLRRSRSV
jgi:hypothetical protein